MPIPRMFVQEAIYWGPREDDEQGQRQFDAPIQVMVRWKDEASIFLDSEGNQQVSNARVRVDREVYELGVLVLGKLSDLEDVEVDPFTIDDAYEIRKVINIPNRMATQTIHIAIL